MTDRKLARLFQGAHISLGEVKDPGRPVTELSDDEVAYIVARLMQQEATRDDSTGLNVYPHAIGFAFSGAFGYESDKLMSRAPAIRKRLKANGVYALMVGRTREFKGYAVPLAFVWASQDPKPKGAEKAEEVEEAPVKTKWQCQKCGQFFDTRQGLGGHMKGHAYAENPEKKKQPKERKKRKASHPLQDQVVEILKDNPGLNANELTSLVNIGSTKPHMRQSVDGALRHLLERRKVRAELHGSRRDGKRFYMRHYAPPKTVTEAADRIEEQREEVSEVSNNGTGGYPEAMADFDTALELLRGVVEMVVTSNRSLAAERDELMKERQRYEKVRELLS